MQPMAQREMSIKIYFILFLFYLPFTTREERLTASTSTAILVFRARLCVCVLLHIACVCVRACVYYYTLHITLHCRVGHFPLGKFDLLSFGWVGGGGGGGAGRGDDMYRGQGRV